MYFVRPFINRHFIYIGGDQMVSTNHVMPEELRRRLQRAQLHPLCWHLAGTVTVKLSLGPYYRPTKVSKFTASKPSQVIKKAEKLLGRKLPQ